MGNIVKNAGAPDAVPVGRIAGAVAAGTVFAGRKFVINRIGIALASPGALVDQRLNPREDGRGERSPAGAGPSAGAPAAKRSAVGNV